jgi:hypothetical protein
MGALGLSTTRANTKTSICAGLARSSERAQAFLVAPEVRTSWVRTGLRPAVSDCRSGGYLECALDLAGPLRARQSALLLGRLTLLKDVAWSLTALCRSITLDRL